MSEFLRARCNVGLAPYDAAGLDFFAGMDPVLVTYGANDVVVPAAHGEWLGRHIPNAEVIVDDGAGHLSELDKIPPMIHWLITGERAG